MKHQLLIAAGILGLAATPAQATLLMWQGQVGTDAPAAATNFSTISAPIVFDVGTLDGDRSFEFIFNANAAAVGSVSSALIGTQSVPVRQGLKFEQWQDTGFFGATAFGVADYTSTVPVQNNVDLHAVFTSNGTTTTLYLNGASAFTFATMGLALTGSVGLGAAVNADGVTFFDVLPGSIYGFASYDTALTAGEILTHYSAFAAVPEPGTAGLAALAALGLTGRRRRRTR